MVKKFLLILINVIAWSFSEFIFAMTLTSICTQNFGANEEPSFLNVWMTPDESRALVAYQNPHNNPFLKKTYKLQCNNPNLTKKNTQIICSMPIDHSDTGGLHITFNRSPNKMMLILESTLLDEEGNLFYEIEEINCTPLSEKRRIPATNNVTNKHFSQF